MTKILAATALAILIATPAFAESRTTNAPKATKSYAYSAPAMRAINRAQPWQPSHSTNPAYDVYVNGEYVGSDPDPRVRYTLREEWRSRWGGSN